jgi:hypothetical protein
MLCREPQVPSMKHTFTFGQSLRFTLQDSAGLMSRPMLRRTSSSNKLADINQTQE